MQGGGTEARSDLYSFSATMYRLLTGTVPPDAMTRVEATNDGLPDPLRPILELAPHVSAPLAEIVQKGMATGKSGRFPSAREMRTAWAACRTLHGASTIVHATAVVPTPSARRPESSDAETVRGGATPQAPVAPAQAPAPAQLRMPPRPRLPDRRPSVPRSADDDVPPSAFDAAVPPAVAARAGPAAAPAILAGRAAADRRRDRRRHADRRRGRRDPDRDDEQRRVLAGAAGPRHAARHAGAAARFAARARGRDAGPERADESPAPRRAR